MLMNWTRHTLSISVDTIFLREGHFTWGWGLGAGSPERWLEPGIEGRRSSWGTQEAARRLDVLRKISVEQESGS